MREPHLDLFALPAGLLEGVRAGQYADAIAHILVEVASDFADGCRRAPWLQGTCGAQAALYCSATRRF